MPSAPMPTPLTWGSGDVLPSAPGPRRWQRWVAATSAGVVIAAVAAAVLVVLGGSSGSVADAATIVHGTSARVTQVGSASVDLQMTVKSHGESLNATGGGAFDFRHHTGQLAISMGGFGEMQEVVTPTALYLRLPDPMSSALGSSRPWVEIRWSELNRPGIDVSKLMNADPSADPSSMLKTLSRATDVRRDGDATVRGVRTTHYSGAATLLDLVRAEGVGDAVDASQLPPALANAKMRFDVWIDRTGLTRQLTMHMSMGGLGTMTLTMDLYDFGKPVDVVVPPSSIVTDFNTLLSSVG